MTEIVSFGEWVQKRRNQLRYTRKGFADLVSCAPITIKKIERDERRPSAEIGKLLATHLQIPEADKDDFMRRSRGEFVARLTSPEEMSLAEAQAPTATEEAPKHNLPSQTTPFFGRERELHQIALQLADPACRLLTILGTGGMGKTRLSIEVARAQLTSFTDGITFVELAPIHAIEGSDSAETLDPIARALANALGMSFQGNSPPEQQLTRYLQRKEMLVVFDNFEHLLESATFLSQILQQAPDIKILTTSRERLNLQEEWTFLLHGLAFSAQTQESDQALSAVELFVQRARQLNVNFDYPQEKIAVLRICQLVEGMPLGLELAATWVNQLSSQDIADEIESELDFLASEIRNVPDRHRSIRAVFSRSWEKLNLPERAILQKLSVFRGGFERNAAKAVAGASLPTLAKLVDKSLLSGSNGRYQIHELLRQFAAEKLAQFPEAEQETFDQHCQHFLVFLSKQKPHIESENIVQSVEAMRQDIANIRLAIRWGVNHHRHLFDQSSAKVITQLFFINGWVLETDQTMGLIATALKSDVPAQLNLKQKEVLDPATLRWLNYQIYWSFIRRFMNNQEGEDALKQCLHLLPSTVSDKSSRWLRGMCLIWLGWSIVQNGDFALAQTYYEESAQLLKDVGSTSDYAMALRYRGWLELVAGNFLIAQSFLQKVLEQAEPIGDKIETGYGLIFLSETYRHQGKLHKAETALETCLAHWEELNYDFGIGSVLQGLAQLHQLRGDLHIAEDYHQRALDLIAEVNIPLTANYWSLGNLALIKGDYEAALALYDKSGLIESPYYQNIGGPGWAMLGLSKFEEAKRLFLHNLKLMLTTNIKPHGIDSLIGIAHLEVRSGELESALRLLALVRHHPDSGFELVEKASKLWGELSAELPAALLSAAETQGRESVLNCV